MNSRLLLLTLVTMLLMSSCREAFDFSSKYAEIEVTQHDRTWWNMIGGITDQNHNWITASRVSATIYSADSAVVSAYTLGQEKRTLFARRAVCGEETIEFDIPQTDAEEIAFECDYGEQKVFRRISISAQDTIQLVVDFTLGGETRALANVDKPADKEYLSGNSISGNAGYSSWPGWTWSDLSHALPENTKPVVGESVRNYELISNGPFYVSLLYGSTGNFNKRTLGYYYYKESGNYSDIKLVYLTETLYYDYIDGLSKLQYQIDNQETWYDANFDIYDGNESLGMLCPIAGRQSYSKQSQRKNDNVYNSVILYNYYQDRISGIRGLTFKVDAPVGYRVGFFLEGGDQNHQPNDAKELSQDQRNKLLNLGVPASALPEKPYYTCWSNNAFNYGGVKYRTAIRRYDHYTFLGIEDTLSGGDGDCNDICLGILAGNGGTMPGILLPGVYDMDKKQYYNEDGTFSAQPADYDPATNAPYATEDTSIDATGQTAADLAGFYLAYEDKGTEGDFDFNDVVIRVVPNTANQAKVYVCAAGGTLAAKLYYEGEQGDQLLCNVHQAIGGTMVNTGRASRPEKMVATVSWPASYSITTDAWRFFLEVAGKKIALSTERGKTPNVLCISDSWRWPLENVNVTTAYPLLGNWAQNAKDSHYWNWYQHPNDECVMSK